MLSPHQYNAIHQIDLNAYYNVAPHQSLRCECCDAEAELKRYSAGDSKVYWYFCPHCKFAGTGLDYLAALENIPPDQLFRKLAKTGTLRLGSERLFHAYRQYVEHQAEILDHYERGTRFLRTESATLSPLENLDGYDHAEKYRMGDRTSFEQWFHPNSGEHNASGSRLFHGRKWSRITAIPLYDMPRRMSSLLFVNGHEQGLHEIAIKRLGPKQSGVFAFEPGYLSTSEIFTGHTRTDSVVLSADWRLVLRLQADIWRQERSVAPIVGWFPYDPRTEKPWNYRWSFFRDTTKVFWSWPNDPVNLREACLQKAMISFAYYDPDTKVLIPPPKRKGDTLLSGALLRSVTDKAIPWHKALCLYLRQDDESVESRLGNLQLPQSLLEFFLQYAPTDLKRIITTRFFSSSAVSRPVDQYVVTTTDEGWHQLQSNPNAPPILLSSARCIVDRVLSLADRKPLYQGRILIRGETHPFVEEESEIEKSPVQFIKGVCLKNGSKYLPVINVSSEKMMRLIRCHGHFEVTHIKSGYGWDDESASLILPNLTVSDRAVVDPEIRLNYGPLSPLVPKHAETLTEDDRKALVSFQEETPYLTAMLASLLPPLFAPAYRMESPQTTVIGPNVELLQKLFEFLQLPASMKGVTQKLHDYIEATRCPYLVKLPPKSGRGDRQNWVDQAGLHGPGFVAASLKGCLARMSYGHGNILIMPKVRFYRWLQGNLPEVFLKVLLLCLRYFSRYVLEPKIIAADWNGELILEAYRYLEQELGLPVHKTTLFDGYYDPANYFCDYVTLLRQQEDIVFSQEDEATLGIPVAELGDCFRRDVGMFDFERIKAILTDTMLLKEYDPARHVFLVHEEPLRPSAKRIEYLYSQAIR